MRLARSKKTGEYFAMKILKKADIIKLKQVDHVISENTILADIDHPFLVCICPHQHLNCIIKLGRIEGIFTGSSVSLLLDGLHTRWRTLHFP